MQIKKAKKTVLLVEDNREITNTINEALELLDCHTLQATNGEEAFDIFQKHKVDFIITDIHMPKMNGLDLLKKIRSTGSPVIIIVTSASVDVNEEHILSLGADYYFCKTKIYSFLAPLIQGQ